MPKSKFPCPAAKNELAELRQMVKHLEELSRRPGDIGSATDAFEHVGQKIDEMQQRWSRGEPYFLSTLELFERMGMPLTAEQAWALEFERRFPAPPMPSGG